MARAPLGTPTRITLVDDIVTKGSMLLATASLVAARFPQADVKAFALIRTLGLRPEIEQVVEPCTGFIRAAPSGTERTP